MSTYPAGANSGPQGGFLPFGGKVGNVLSQAVVTAYNIFPPDNLMQLFQRHDVPIPYNQYLHAIGAVRGTATPTTGHYENDWFIDNCLIGSVVTPAGGAGQDMIVALDPSSMVTIDVNGNPQTGSYVNQNDILDLGPGVKALVVLKDTSFNPYRLTLRPNNTTVNLNSYVTAGKRLAIGASAYGEGTEFGEGRISQVFKYTNSFQYFKDGVGTTGTQLANTTVFEPVPDTEGTYFLKVQSEWYKRHQYNKDQAIVFASASNNFSVTPTSLGYSVGVPTTEGMVDFVYNYGQKNNYNLGLLAVQDFDQNGRVFTQQRISTKVLDGLAGYDAFLEMENTLKDYAGDKQIFVKGLDGDTEFEVHVGFRLFKKGSYDYRVNEFAQFSFVKGQGAADYPYHNWIMFFPLYMVFDKELNRETASMGWEYKMLDGYSRNELFKYQSGSGKMGQMVTTFNGADIDKYSLESEIAFHGACPNQALIMLPY